MKSSNVICNKVPHFKNEEASLPSSVVHLKSLLSPGIAIERSLSLLRATLYRGWNNDLESAFHILSADCGTGKSRTVQAVIAELKSNGFADGGSALMMLATKEEIDAYIAGCGLDRDDYAVLSPDNKYSGYGRGRSDADNARILFVTHEQVRRRLADVSSFDDATCFYYRGRPRSLRVWDEGLCPARYTALSINDLRALPAALVGMKREDVATIEKLLPDRGDLTVGSKVVIPDALRNIADSMGMRPGVSAKSRATLESLHKLAGMTAVVRHSGRIGWYLVGISKAIPADLAPLIVLDASARLTRYYDGWSDQGLPVRWMEPALVDYSKLAIHWWDRGCGKEVLSEPESRAEIYSAVADLINAKAAEQWVIVMRKANAYNDAADEVAIPRLPADLADRLTAPDNVSVVTWGRHHGTNAFRDVANIVVLGSYGYSEGGYEAIHAAHTGRVTQQVHDTGIAAAQDAEFMQNIYQAICRSRVRCQTDGICGQATAHIVMPWSERRAGLLQRAFPGASLATWQPVASKKQSKLERVQQVALEMFETRLAIDLKDLTKACGGRGAYYLTRTISDERFKKFMEENGIKISGRKLVRNIRRDTTIAA